MDSSSSAKTVGANWRGAMLISMLNCPSSVWKSGSAIASSTAALASAGPAVVVGQVELDLQAERAARRLEALVGQHAREDVQARAHLLAVALAVGTAEHPGGDVLAHGSGRQCSPRGRRAQPLFDGPDRRATPDRPG